MMQSADRGSGGQLLGYRRPRGEDAGVLLCVVLDDGSESSYLLVLDAEPIA